MGVCFSGTGEIIGSGVGRAFPIDGTTDPRRHIDS